MTNWRKIFSWEIQRETIHEGNTVSVIADESLLRTISGTKAAGLVGIVTQIFPYGWSNYEYSGVVNVLFEIANKGQVFGFPFNKWYDFLEIIE